MLINLSYLLVDVIWLLLTSLHILTLEFLKEFFWVVNFEVKELCPVAVYRNLSSAIEKLFFVGDILPYLLAYFSWVLPLLAMVTLILVFLG